MKMFSAWLAMYPVRHCGETEMPKWVHHDINQMEGRAFITEMQASY